MALVVTLAKVAVGFARSRGLLGDAEHAPGDRDVEKARAMLQQVGEGRDKARQLVSDLQNGKGRERVRGLVRDVAEKRGLLPDKPAATEDAQEAEPDSEHTTTGAKAELGVDVMMTALSGAAAGTGHSVDALLDAYGGANPVAGVDETANLMLRAMLMAVRADGEIDAEEKAAILTTLGPETDAEHHALVQDILSAPVDVTALAEATSPDQAVQVYSSALMAIRLDTPPEAIFLDRLARALDLSEAVVNALHVQAGRQRLYRQG